MARFEDHIEKLIEKEGGYVLTDRKNDRGRRTFAGISERWNPDWAGWGLIDCKPEFWNVRVRKLVHDLYRTDYWDPIRGDDLADDDVAEILFSSAVLSHPTTAIRMAQDALHINVDGKVGPITLAHLNDCNARIFRPWFACARMARFSRIVARDPDQLEHLRGWINRPLRELGFEV